jgi:chorismate-pyruvate lyase
MHMSLTLTKLLNSIFGQKAHIDLLEDGNLKEDQMEEDLTGNKEGKKKKKKNKNKEAK